jgi:hypothetical protein
VLAELRQSATQHYVPAIYMAAIYTALGDSNEAIRWTQQGYDERSIIWSISKLNPGSRACAQILDSSICCSSSDPGTESSGEWILKTGYRTGIYPVRTPFAENTSCHS